MPKLAACKKHILTTLIKRDRVLSQQEDLSIVCMYIHGVEDNEDGPITWAVWESLQWVYDIICTLCTLCWPGPLPPSPSISHHWLLYTLPSPLPPATFQERRGIWGPCFYLKKGDGPHGNCLTTCRDYLCRNIICNTHDGARWCAPHPSTRDHLPIAIHLNRHAIPLQPIQQEAYKKETQWYHNNRSKLREIGVDLLFRDQSHARARCGWSFTNNEAVSRLE